MNHSESLANIAAALSKAQASVKIAIKDSSNPHLKSKYADLGSVWEACRAALTDNGLSVLQLPVTDEPGYIALETMVLHASGEFISARARIRLQKDDPQGAGSGLTYLRRYALSAALGIVADEDDDGHAASAPRTPQTRQQAPARPSAPPATPQAPQSAPERLTAGQAQSLHKRLGLALQDTNLREMTHNEFAGQILRRTVKSLTELTTTEAQTVLEAANKEARAA